MSITDELRKVIEDPLLGYAPQDQHIKILTEIADRIDAEHERQCAESWMRGHDAWAAIERSDEMAEHGWIRLPKDADGEIIHVGDMMERGEAHGRVIALMLSNYPKKWGGELHWGVQLEGEQAPTALDAFFHHYHAPTVEDVLREMLDAWGELPAEATNEAIVAEYAAKLRLAGDAE